jgi:hypothetical protein
MPVKAIARSPIGGRSRQGDCPQISDRILTRSSMQRYSLACVCDRFKRICPRREAADLPFKTPGASICFPILGYRCSRLTVPKKLVSTETQLRHAFYAAFPARVLVATKHYFSDSRHAGSAQGSYKLAPTH